MAFASSPTLRTVASLTQKRFIRRQISPSLPEGGPVASILRGQGFSADIGFHSNAQLLSGDSILTPLIPSSLRNLNMLGASGRAFMAAVVDVSDDVSWEP